jgi:hypothetical protein
LPVPEFKQENSAHSHLAALAEGCSERLKDIIPTLTETGSIGRARSAVRQNLKEELAEIDSLVKQILK